jgi:PTS system beta-glucosides-specific IIC component
MYGVNLPKRYPLIAAMIGGAAGGLYAGLTGTRRFAGGSSGILALPMYIGNDTLQYFYSILVALVISIVITAVITVLLSFWFERSAAIEQAGAGEGDPAANQDTASGSLYTKVSELVSPCNGAFVPLASVHDEAFSSGSLGPGFGIEPRDGAIISPCQGTIDSVADTGHAFCIRTDDGIDVLVHVGIDTVKMKGQGFVAAVKEGDRVVAGQLLVTADLKAIIAAGLLTTVVVIIAEAEGLRGVDPLATGDVITGVPILSIKRERKEAST